MGILQILKNKFLRAFTNVIKEQTDIYVSMVKDAHKELENRLNEAVRLDENANEDIRNIISNIREEEEEKECRQLAFVKKKMQDYRLRSFSHAFIEESCLRMCNIQQLLNKLHGFSYDFKSVCMVTSTLGNFIEKKDGWEVIQRIENWNKEKMYEQLIMVNPKDAYEFLSWNQLYENVMYIKDELVFLMPCIHKGGFQVIWDEGFGAVETDGQSFYRWYIGGERIGKIMIYNDFDCLKPVRIQFETYTANPDAGILIKCGDYYSVMNLKLCGHEFCMETILIPGKNEIEIAFCGEICNLSEAEQRKCQFTVTNFRIEDLEKCVVYTGLQVYERQCHSCCSKYILSERFIRSVLHENGCFEIEKYACKTDGIDWIDTTRAYVSYGGYYILRQEEAGKKDTGMAMYIARRKGRSADAG